MTCLYLYCCNSTWLCFGCTKLFELYFLPTKMCDFWVLGTRYLTSLGFESTSSSSRSVSAPINNCTKGYLSANAGLQDLRCFPRGIARTMNRILLRHHSAKLAFPNCENLSHGCYKPMIRRPKRDFWRLYTQSSEYKTLVCPRSFGCKDPFVSTLCGTDRDESLDDKDATTLVNFYVVVHDIGSRRSYRASARSLANLTQHVSLARHDNFLSVTSTVRMLSHECNMPAHWKPCLQSSWNINTLCVGESGLY